jgi:hypothetical protein
MVVTGTYAGSSLGYGVNLGSVAYGPGFMGNLDFVSSAYNETSQLGHAYVPNFTAASGTWRNIGNVSVPARYNSEGTQVCTGGFFARTA